MKREFIKGEIACLESEDKPEMIMEKIVLTGSRSGSNNDREIV